MTARPLMFAALFGLAHVADALAQASVTGDTPVPRDRLDGTSRISPTDAGGHGSGDASMTGGPTGPGTPGTTGTGALGAGPTGTMAAPGR